jgi:hypothetical protein
MAFPYDLEATFEQGDNSEWTGETDTVDQLDFPNYRELARVALNDMIPFNGAYAMRLSLIGGTADAFVNETFAIALGVTSWFRFRMYVSPDFAATVQDIFNIFEVLATTTVEGSFGLRANTDGTVEFGVGEVAPTVFSEPLTLGAHYTVEVQTIIDTGPNDGIINVFITKDGEPRAASATITIGSLDQLAITQFRLGVQDHLATTTGVILISGFIADSDRLDVSERFPTTIDVTKDRHLFIGPGYIDYAQMMTSTAGHIASFYDTDVALATSGTFAAEVSVDIQPTLDTPIPFQKGCYVRLTGTNPRVNVHIADDIKNRRYLGPKYYSPSGVKRLGRVAAP